MHSQNRGLSADEVRLPVPRAAQSIEMPIEKAGIIIKDFRFAIVVLLEGWDLCRESGSHSSYSSDQWYEDRHVKKTCNELNGGGCGTNIAELS